MKINPSPAIIELAAKYDRLANEANFDESKHPRSEDGKFTSGGGGSGGSRGYKRDDTRTSQGYKGGALSQLRDRASKASWINSRLASNRRGKVDPEESRGGREVHYQRVRGVHIAAIAAGLKYNRSTHQYE